VLLNHCSRRRGGRRSGRFTCAAWLAASLLLVAGCARDLPLTPSIQAPEVPSRDWYLSVREETFELPPASSLDSNGLYGGVEWRSTGITVAKGDYFQFSIQGLLALGVDPDAFKVGPAGWNHAGSPDIHYLRVNLRIKSGTEEFPLRYFIMTPDGSSVGTFSWGVAPVSGVIEIERKPQFAAGHKPRGDQVLKFRSGTPVPINKPKVELKCDRTTLVRGESIACSATLTGGATIAEWRFQGDGEPIVSSHQEPTWAGRMVASGKISVVLEGATEPAAEIDVTVLDRNWSGRGPTVSVKRVEIGEDSRMDSLPHVPKVAHELGYTSFFLSPTPDADLPDPTEEVQGGPNDGMEYFSDTKDFPVYGIYILNSAAMSGRSEWAMMHEAGTNASSVKLGGVNWCDRSVFADLSRLVEAHELRHVEVYKAAYTREFRTRSAALERMVDADASVLLDQYTRLHEEIDILAVKESEAIHRLKGNPNLVETRDGAGPCVLKDANGGELLNAEENS